jgi:hypothetical protein
MTRLIGVFPLLITVGCGSSSDNDVRPELDTLLSDAPDVVMYLADQLPEGFRGDAHPLLDSKDQVVVTASWSRTGTGRASTLGYVPPQFHEPFRNLRAANLRQTYASSDFSAFLPADENLASVGSMWTLDLPGIQQILQQLHPAVSMTTRSTGRLSGPDGGVGIVRAASPTHAEIAFRVHAELNLEPGVYYTPAHFSGHLIVNRKSGSVEHFEIGIPAESTLNVTLTIALPTEVLVLKQAKAARADGTFSGVAMRA